MALWHLFSDDSLMCYASLIVFILIQLLLCRHLQIALYPNTSLTYKYWWDQELDLLKLESVKNHRMWTALGRPRYGKL